MRWSYLLLAALLAAPSISEGAGDGAIDRATLRGLKEVNVVLDPLAADLLKAGLTAIDLQTRLQGRLKEAGITVNETAPEFLGLRVLAARDKRGPFAVAFNLGLYQPVMLVRDHNLRSATSTWEVENVVMADPKILHQAAVETVDDLAAHFIAAYRSANPQ